MKLTERLRELLSGKRGTAAAVILGCAGLLLILISSLIPDKEPEPAAVQETAAGLEAAADYRADTERRLAGFLSRIEGAGEVEVYLTIGSSERSVYASEGKRTQTAEKSEVEEKYVIVGGSGGKEALLEMTAVPEVTGAVIICTGGGSPAVQERIYRAASAALGLSAADIYVTQMK
ncbi:MAG: hypothetical protein IJ874_04360 [Ruminococcus sp.]|nr:hypothetical protein [Ruminococcus sp.]